MIIYVVLAVIIVLLILALLYFIIDNKYMKSKIDMLKEKEEDSRREKYEVVDTMRRCCNKVDNLSHLIRAVKIKELVEDGEGYVKYRGDQLQKFRIGNMDVCKHNNNMKEISIEGIIMEKKEEQR